MDEIKVEILGLLKLDKQKYALFLQDIEKKTGVEICIGINEGQAIALGTEKVKINRPLTHDLFKNFLNAFAITIEKIIICDLIEDVFYAKIICNDTIHTKEIDARVSDAIALAVRFNAPIYIKQNILKTVGIPVVNSSVEFTKITSTNNAQNDLQNLSTEILTKKLNTFLKEEKYEEAAEIKKILDNRNTQ